MKESVTVSLGVTLNTGNFNSLRVDYGLTAHVNDGESYADAFDRISAEVEAKFLERVRDEQAEITG